MSTKPQAETLLNEGKFEDALREFSALIEKDPNNIDLFVSRSGCHYKLKNYTGKPRARRS
jgi:hypothetical protein